MCRAGGGYYIRVASHFFQLHGRTIRGQILLTVVLSMVAQRITSRRLGGRDRLQFVLIPMSSSRPPTTNDDTVFVFIHTVLFNACAGPLG